MREHKRNAVSLIILIVVFILITGGLIRMNRSTQKNSRISLENAVQRGVLECYAMEGAYPRSLSYLEKNYHIAYDHKSYKVIYHYKGEQHLPSYQIVKA